MTKAQKIVHIVCVVLIAAGLFGILGTAGRADTTDAALSSIIIQLVISIGISVAGFCGLNVLAKK